MRINRFVSNDSGLPVYDRLYDKDVKVDELGELYDDLWKDYVQVKKENGKLFERLCDLEDILIHTNMEKDGTLKSLVDWRDKFFDTAEELKKQKDKNYKAGKKIQELLKEIDDFKSDKKIQELLEELEELKQKLKPSKIVVGVQVNEDDNKDLICHPTPDIFQNAYGGFDQPPKPDVDYTGLTTSYVNYVDATNKEVKK